MNQEEFCRIYAANRIGTNSKKWDAILPYKDPSMLPVWVADCDFKISEKIQEALHQAVDFGVMGYTDIPRSYIDAVIDWQYSRYHYQVKGEWMRFTPGVVSAITWLVNAMTKPGDEIMVLNPVYPPFMNVVKNGLRKLVCVDLHNECGVYTIDFEAVEECLRKNDIKMFIHCSPHNPVGRVWTSEESDKLMQLMEKYNVLIISDEIHQDLTLGYQHIPSVLANQMRYRSNILTITSPSKTFNLAGCSVAQIFIEDERLRQRYDEFVATIVHGAKNIMGFVASEAGYRFGTPWLNGLIATVSYNYELLKTKLQDTAIIISPLEGTYLAWLDFSRYCSGEELESLIIQQAHLLPNFGSHFGMCAQCCIRINLATDTKIIEEAANRIAKLIKK